MLNSTVLQHSGAVLTVLTSVEYAADLRRGSIADVVSADHLSYGEVAWMAAVAARGSSTYVPVTHWHTGTSLAE